jgi:hypothetical protein
VGALAPGGTGTLPSVKWPFMTTRYTVSLELPGTESPGVATVTAVPSLVATACTDAGWASPLVLVVCSARASSFPAAAAGIAVLGTAGSASALLAVLDLAVAPAGGSDVTRDAP